MLFQHVPFLGEEFLRAVRENHANAFHVKRFDVVGEFQIQILNGQFGQTFAAVDRCSDLGVGFQEQGGQARSCGVKRSGTTSRAGADNHDIVHVQPLR